MAYTAFVVTTSNEVFTTEINHYTDIQRHVGGLFDVVECTWTYDGDTFNCDMFVHDEGLILGLPWNPTGAALAQRPIVGDVVITGPPDRDGNGTDYDPKVLAYVVAVLQAQPKATDPREVTS